MLKSLIKESSRRVKYAVYGRGGWGILRSTAWRANALQNKVAVREASPLLRWRQNRAFRRLLKAEAVFLEANGWRKHAQGWQTPAWHPKRAKEDPNGDARYDQNHAVNSQRKHGSFNYWEVVVPNPKKMPQLFCGRWDFKAFKNWVFWTAVLYAKVFIPMGLLHAAYVGVCVVGFLGGHLYIYLKARRDVELDEAEKILRGEGPRTPYRSK